MLVELNNEQVELLRGLIEERVRNLDLEIHRTETRDYREGLQNMHDEMDAILQRLSPATV